MSEAFDASRRDGEEDEANKKNKAESWRIKISREKEEWHVKEHL